MFGYQNPKAKELLTIPGSDVYTGLSIGKVSAEQPQVIKQKECLVIKAMLRTAFPPTFTSKQQNLAMRKSVRRIVSLHSSGNVALQNGRYATGAKLNTRHKKAQKAVAHF